MDTVTCAPDTAAHALAFGELLHYPSPGAPYVAGVLPLGVRTVCARVAPRPWTCTEVVHVTCPECLAGLDIDTRTLTDLVGGPAACAAP